MHILIGSAPCTGKSTLARQLSRTLNMPYISTDDLREIVSPYASREAFPHLAKGLNISAEAYHALYTPEQIVENVWAESRDIWPALCALLVTSNRCESPHKISGWIIEGVNVLPSVIHHDGIHDRKEIKTLFLFDDDQDRVRKTIYEGGVFDQPHLYSDEIKEKELQWINFFSDRLKKEVLTYAMPYMSVTRTENDLKKALSLLQL